MPVARKPPQRSGSTGPSEKDAKRQMDVTKLLPVALGIAAVVFASVMPLSLVAGAVLAFLPYEA